MRALIIGNGIVGQATALTLQHKLGRDLESLAYHDLNPARSTVPIEFASECDAAFICVSGPGGVRADSYMVSRMEGELLRVMDAYAKPWAQVVQRTTCLPGTALADPRIVVWPEFLRQQYWQQDALHPSRLVFGMETAPKDWMLRLAKTTRAFSMSRKEAEVTKLAANAALAMRISFWNDLGEHATDAVKMALGADPRLAGLEQTLHGAAWGGRCFPKDLTALIDWLQWMGIDARTLKGVRATNERMPRETDA